MTRRVIGTRLIRRGVVSSTMDEAMLLADEGAAEGTVVLAEHQTAGRGRAGRVWTEHPGDGLLLSVILRPPVPVDRLALLPLLIGVAVAEALEKMAVVACQVKWPNDIWIDDRKIAGILITSHQRGGTRTVIAGIGVNVDMPVERLAEGAVSLRKACGRCVRVEDLLHALIDVLNAAYVRFVEQDGRVGLADWKKRAALLGERVVVVQDGEAITGLFHDVDEDGALVLLTDAGECRRVVSGDLVRGPSRIG
ncbi:MAG: biotin--[acetyl-CoA-carboxylase] ligase [Thermomicrobiales bacterium]